MGQNIKNSLENGVNMKLGMKFEKKTGINKRQMGHGPFKKPRNLLLWAI